MKTVFFKSWSEKGVYLVSDLIDNDKWMSFGTFQAHYDINCNFLTYYGIITVKKNNN